MKTRLISVAATLLLAASVNTASATYYLVGSFCNWKDEGKIEFPVVDNVPTLSMDNFNGWFKIVDGNNNNTWLGANNGSDYWLLKSNPSVDLVTNYNGGEPAAIYLPVKSNYKFTIKNGKLTVDGFLYIAGTFNDWQGEMMSYQDGAYSIEYQLTNGDRFKFIDNENKWYGGDTQNQGDVYGIHNNHHSNIPLTEGNSGSDFIIERTGTYTFKVTSDNKLTVEGFPPLVTLNNANDIPTSGQIYDVVLGNRTLTGGVWNTLCVPFNVTNFTGNGNQFYGCTKLCGEIDLSGITNKPDLTGTFLNCSNVKRITMHEFRHSHVSLLINEYVKASKEKNMKIDTAKFFLMMADRMGHTIQVMQDTYMHLFPTVQDEIVDLLNNL